MAKSTDVIRELVGSLLSKTFDPQPITFRPNDDAGVGPVCNGCKKPDGTLHTFRTALNRNAFLSGCAECTHLAQVEHLIVGFGFRRGSTTVVDRMTHAIGTRESVTIPTHVASAIVSHVQQEYANEVLIFHSHPRNPMNVVFDNTPLASGPDRHALVSFHRDLTTLGKAVFGGGRVRFYIGENGFVQEFRTPDLLSLADRLLRSRTVRHA